jgi:hypothetical protein
MSQLNTQVGSISGTTSPAELVRRVVVSVARQKYGESLRAVVLTGSLSRNEGTFVPRERGFNLVGDCDLLLIFNDSRELPSAQSIDGFERSAGAMLADAGITGIVSASAGQPKYLIDLKPSIFAYELRTNGTVLWGDSDCIRLIPEFASCDIPLEDAWRMLCNRIIECLDCSSEGSPEFDEENRLLAITKLYLDMTTSLLVFLRRYHPSYGARLAELEKVVSETGSVLPFITGEFVEHVRRCTEWKLSGTGIPIDKDSAIAAYRFAHELFRWELQRLTDSDEFSDNHHLIKTWAAKQSVTGKMRGWATVTRTCLQKELPIHPFRWSALAIRISPRHAIYAAGAELFFKSDSATAAADWNHLRSALPISRSTSGLWCDVAADVVWNYKTFLTGTTA